MNPWRLENKKAIVTGGTKGIGKAIADELLSLGAEVLLIARNQNDLENTKEQYAKEGYQIEILSADVSLPEDRQNIKEKTTQLWGSLDILVNNAGINIRKQTNEYSIEDYRQLMAVNLESAWDLSRLFFDYLKASEGGNIVNIASVAGQRALLTSTAAYAMAKAGMEQMTKFLAAEWGKDGIRINSVLPWYTRTPLAEQVLKDDAKKEKILSRTPMLRIGEPEEVARAACFMAMPAASYITGVSLPVDGGFLTLGI
ncbi:glucose 1-dehydrogenase [Limibacter armeniacum]|uniref:glucose 1-dehydrogenase n=1 Tax=Limibacter armeniacum TaxID=466084 RepID=UPI002FE6A64B